MIWKKSGGQIKKKSKNDQKGEQVKEENGNAGKKREKRED